MYAVKVKMLREFNNLSDDELLLVSPELKYQSILCSRTARMPGSPAMSAFYLIYKILS
jgi:hypothetical protein